MATIRVCIKRYIGAFKNALYNYFLRRRYNTVKGIDNIKGNILKACETAIERLAQSG